MYSLFFTIPLVILNILFFIKKKYIYLFIPCILFLPDYYGLDLSESLPLFTVARMMYLVFFLYAFIYRRRNFGDFKVSFKKYSTELTLLFGYFIFRIISNLYYVTTLGQAAKTILLIIFEQLLLMVGFYFLSPSQEEITKLVKVIVWSSTFLFCFGIFESFTGIKLFNALYTAKRYVLNDYYVRLGLLRATTTLGLANFFGNVCMFIMPVAFYLLQATKQKRYYAAVIIDLFAVIHSGCRSNMIFMIIISLIYFVYMFAKKEERILFIKQIFIVVFISVTIMSFLSINERLRYYYVGTAKSLLNEVGFDFDLNEDAPEGVKGYGSNKKSGRLSRTSQFTGIEYALSQNPLFGLGSGAQTRDQICYYQHRTGEWKVFNTYDMGIVEILCDEGILGFAGYLMFFSSFAVILFKMRKIHSPKHKIFVVELITYLLSTLSTVNMPIYLLLLYIITPELFMTS